MDAKKRAGGATVSLAWIAGFGRELATLPPDKTLDMLGDIISPHSFYLALTVLGLGALVYFGWPVVAWTWTIPKRRDERARAAREQKQKTRLERKASIIEVITKLKELLRDPLLYSLQTAQRETQILVFQQRLINERVLPDSYRGKSERELRSRLEAVLPYIIQYGVDEGVSNFERDVREFDSDEDGNGA